MTLYDFKQLNDNKKAAFILRSCQFLIRRKVDSHHSASLYHHCQRRSSTDFFIEVQYNTASNCIDGIRSFRTNRLLEPYLEMVKLEGLEK